MTGYTFYLDRHLVINHYMTWSLQVFLCLLLQLYKGLLCSVLPLVASGTN